MGVLGVYEIVVTRFNTVFIAALSIFSSAAAQSLDADLRGALDTAMKENGIVGASVAVVRKGNPIFMAQVGYANQESRTPVSKATTFALGTTGQLFISISALAQVDSGKWTLDSVLPESKPKSITLRQALGQASGLSDFTQDPQFDQSEIYGFASLYKMALVKADRPGERFSYSESNALLVSQALFRLTDEPIGETVLRTVFRPAGMTTAKFEPSAATAKGYFSDGSGDKSTARAISAYPVGLASLYGAQFTANIDDMLAFDRAVRGRKLLSAKIWNQALTPVSTKTGASEFGLGFDMAEILENEKWYGRSGGTDGFSSCYFRVDATDTSIIILLNTDNQDGFEIARSMYEIIRADDELKSQGTSGT
ncbi:MAG: beta-lactamase family protein [Chthonomonas sp.]|nr:beta-lactamase family protein [Chthonomonas sp.]